MQENLELTAYEYELVQSDAVMLAKNRIMTKVVNMFAGLSDLYVAIATGELPGSLLSIPPKISKGEQYHGVPYVMLDYPRNFGKLDKLAIRTMFWWGNNFSIHLHVSGSFKAIVLPVIEKWLHNNRLRDWYWCYNTDEWQHYFENDNYRSIDNECIEFMQNDDRTFIKLAKKIPLKQWNDAEKFLLECFTELILLLKDQAPIR